MPFFPSGLAAACWADGRLVAGDWHSTHLLICEAEVLEVFWGKVGVTAGGVREVGCSLAVRSTW